MSDEKQKERLTIEKEKQEEDRRKEKQKVDNNLRWRLNSCKNTSFILEKWIWSFPTSKR